MKRWAIALVSLLCLAAPLTMGFSRQIVYVQPISAQEVTPADMAAALPGRIKLDGAEVRLQWQGGEASVEEQQVVTFTATVSEADHGQITKFPEQVNTFLFQHAESLSQIYGKRQPVLVQVSIEADEPVVFWQFSHTPGQEAVHGFVE